MFRKTARGERLDRPRLLLMPVETPKVKPVRRKRRMVARLTAVIAITAAAFVSGGVGATANVTPANAILENPFNSNCMTEAEFQNQTLDPWPGGNISALAGGGSVVFAASNGIVNDIADPSGNAGSATSLYPDSPVGAPVTAYEWWGLAGLGWRVNNNEAFIPYSDCGFTSFGWSATSLVSNLIWSTAVNLGAGVILIYSFSTAPNFMNVFLQPLNQVLTSAKDSLFLPFLIPMVMLAALWIAWVGLVKKRSSESVQGVIWVLCAASLSIIFLTYPVWFVKGLNDVVATVQNAVISTITDPGAKATGEDSLCYVGNGSTGTTAPVETPIPAASALPDGTAPAPIKNLDGTTLDLTTSRNEQSLGSRNFQCIIWQTFLFEPWASGQFGNMSGVEMPEYNAMDKDSLNPVEGEELYTPVTINGRQIEQGSTWALQYMNAVTLNHDEALSSDKGIQEKQEALSNMQNWLVDRYIDPLEEQNDSSWVERQAGIDAFVGAQGGQQISLAFLALIALLCCGIPILVLSVKMLFYQFMFIVMLLLAPLYLTVGIHPGFGRRIALGWLEYILNLAIKRVAIVALLSVMMIVIQIVIRA